jgi:transaldolase
MTSLEKLKAHTIVVADTGDFEQIKKYAPRDSTTNPSLIYAAAQLSQYKHLVEDAVKFGKKNGKTLDEQTSKALDKIAVNFGLEILKLVEGRVSTEVDARLSFDKEANIKKARELIALYKDAGVAKERILIKIASTWEGIEAAKELEKEGIHCNLTLLFSQIQAAACAEAGVTLISPFVGRITDFYKTKLGKSGFDPKEDPGCVSVKSIFNYYKHYGYKTVVMGASFRSKEQCMELCGCDLLTISPKLLEDLHNANEEVPVVLDKSKITAVPKLDVSESNFRWELNQDEMATFKLAEGIRKFAEDLEKLEKDLKERIQKL